jgi:hypothetical protein
LFKKPIDAGEVASHYELVDGLNWNMNENMEVVGIYFEEKDAERLHNDIHDVLWFFGEFEDGIPIYYEVRTPEKDHCGFKTYKVKELCVCHYCDETRQELINENN